MLPLQTIQVRHRTTKQVQSNHRQSFGVPTTKPHLWLCVSRNTRYHRRKLQIITHYIWGLIPAWAKDEEIQKYTLNAKIETVNEKPSFKNSVNKRCLVITNGYFEWQWLDPKGKNKQKYEIGLRNEVSEMMFSKYKSLKLISISKKYIKFQSLNNYKS